MRPLYPVVLSALLSGPAVAAELTMRIEIPRLNVAEYHRPYVAVWLERPDQSVVANLAVWYDLELKNNEGTKWLKDMRQWWRRTGRELAMPVDGLTGATRAPGEHQLAFPNAAAQIAGLSPGEYRIVVEAAREVGGRELLRLPFQWPPAAAVNVKARGEHELGAIQVDLRP